MPKRIMANVWVALLATALVGCASDRPMNPSFALTRDQAARELERMHREPAPLRRPVVVLNGWLDPGLASSGLVRELERCAEDGRFVEVAFLGAGDFEQCRQWLLDAVEAELPADDPDQRWTQPVDVVAFSMGGLVARYSALSAAQRAAVFGEEAVADDGRRLRIVRLFTISTPHRGARMAGWAPWDGLARDMHAESRLLEQLNAAQAEQRYELYPYIRLEDAVVGPANAAPPGRHPWWVSTPLFSNAHLSAHKDPRIRADIAARLRGEQGYATRPAAPVPSGHDAPTAAGDGAQAAQAAP